MIVSALFTMNANQIRCQCSILPSTFKLIGKKVVWTQLTKAFGKWRVTKKTHTHTNADSNPKNTTYIVLLMQIFEVHQKHTDQTMNSEDTRTNTNVYPYIISMSNRRNCATTRSKCTYAPSSIFFSQFYHTLFLSFTHRFLSNRFNCQLGLPRNESNYCMWFGLVPQRVVCVLFLVLFAWMANGFSCHPNVDRHTQKTLSILNGCERKKYSIRLSQMKHLTEKSSILPYNHTIHWVVVFVGIVKSFVKRRLIEIINPNDSKWCVQTSWIMFSCVCLICYLLWRE